MKIKIKCPNCEQKLRIPLNFKKLKVKCPKCSLTFIFKFGFPLLDKLSSKLKLFLEKKKGDNQSFFYSTSRKGNKSINKIFILWITILIIMLLFIGLLKGCKNNTAIDNYETQNDTQKLKI